MRPTRSGRVGPDEDPTDAHGAIPGGDVEQTPPDVISDPGLEGGVDAPNEEPEEPGTEP